MTLSLVGLSHHVAPVELRERVTLDAAAAAELARSLGDAVCLSTCNRTELYLADADDERALAALGRIAGEPLDGVAYRLHEDAAALHLFRVAELARELGRGVEPERHPLPQLDRRDVVRQPDERQRHAKWPPASARRATITSAKPQTARYAARRPVGRSARKPP